jgi:hypothetical protein
VSIISTLERTYEAAANDPTRQVFTEIERETCGEVFAMNGTPTIIKVPIIIGHARRLKDVLVFRAK